MQRHGDACLEKGNQRRDFPQDFVHAFPQRSVTGHHYRDFSVARSGCAEAIFNSFLSYRRFKQAAPRRQEQELPDEHETGERADTFPFG